MKNILVVNVNWVGDVVFSAPVFSALKEIYPGCKITCMAVPRVRDVLECIDDIDEIIEYDERGKDRFLFGKWRIVQMLKQKNFDCVYHLHRSWTRSLLTYLARIPRRVGYDTKKRGFLLTDHIESLKGEHHRSQHYLHVVENGKIDGKTYHTKLTVPEDAINSAQVLLKESGVKQKDFTVLCHVVANWDLKRWPPQNFAKCIDELTEKFHAKVIIPGTGSDAPYIAQLVTLCRQKPIVLVDKTNLKELMGLMKSVDMIISADSGPLHLANSIGTSAIGLFGPTQVEITGPVGSGDVQILRRDVGCNRKACYFLQCPDNICMQAITVRDVINAVRTIKN